MNNPTFRNDVQLITDVRSLMDETDAKRVTIEAKNGTFIFNGFAAEITVKTVPEVPNPRELLGFEVVMRFVGTGEPELIRANGSERKDHES